MKVSMQADQRFWLELPRLSEVDSIQAAQWQDAVLDRMKIARQGTMSPQEHRVLREALSNGLRRILPEDVATVQFWPNASIANVVVHVTAAEFAPDDNRRAIPLVDLAYVTQPVTEVFETEFLGSGIEARYLTPVEREPGLSFGGVNSLFANDFGYIAVGMEPTLPVLLGVALEPLRELVRSISVVDDPEGVWRRCTTDPATGQSRGEQWPTSPSQGTTSEETA